jgi:hypothetical protein
MEANMNRHLHLLALGVVLTALSPRAVNGQVAASADASAGAAGDASLGDIESNADAEPAAQEPPAEPGNNENALESRAHTGLVLGAKVGGGLGKPFSEFGATPVVELELGYMLPPLHRSFELFVSGQYAQPGISGVTSQADPRLPSDGRIHYDLTQQELALSLGALYRIDVGTKMLMPYGGVAGRMYMLNTQIKGTAGGQSYGDNHETRNAFGLSLLGGVELYLGPGALLGELSFGWASVNGFVLRNTNLGALSLAVGYRLML